ncbi:hypothetical protein EBU95_05340 [bacterium]|nr:hypothetical protein [bacterium]
MNGNRTDPLEKYISLLESHNIHIDTNLVSLSETQQAAFDMFSKGASILILGRAGTGKSKLLEEIYKYAHNKENKFVYLTSTTGISAYNIGGVTINSFMGIGTGEMPLESLVRRVRSKRAVRERLQTIEVLVIDEISMMSAELFEKLDLICRHIRRRPNVAFGGIQLVLSGDFLQLKAIFQPDAKDTRLIIESSLFNEIFSKSTFVLESNFRQQYDKVYDGILSRIRLGTHTAEDIAVLKTRAVKSPKKGELMLVSSNHKAQATNNLELSKIDAVDVYFDAEYNSNGADARSLMDELTFQFKQKGIHNIRLRKGCRVILIKNLDVPNGLVNGSVGTVVDILSNSVRVKFDNGYTEIVGRVEFALEMDGVRCTGRQLPLMLAYSITIHRSQSLSLDSAVLDLEECFCDAQVYVALSRIRTLGGLYLKSFDPKRITVDQKLLDYSLKL